MKIYKTVFKRPMLIIGLSMVYALLLLEIFSSEGKMTKSILHVNAAEQYVENGLLVHSQKIGDSTTELYLQAGLDLLQVI